MIIEKDREREKEKERGHYDDHHRSAVRKYTVTIVTKSMK